MSQKTEKRQFKEGRRGFHLFAGFIRRAGLAVVGTLSRLWAGVRSMVLVARSGFIRDRLGRESVAVVRHGDQLRITASRLGSAFTDVGRSLEQMSDSSGALVAKTGELIDLAVGQVREDVKLDSAMEVVKGPLDFLEQSRARTEDLVGMLDDYVGQINRINTLQVEIGNAVAPLKYIQTLFKIESAPLPVEIQQIFVGLTKDIERLHTEVVSMFDRQFSLLRETQQTIRVVSGRLRETCAKQKSTVDANRSRIEVALVNLQRDLERNQRHDARITHISQEIADEVGELVMAMQVQDMVNQKMQHVREVFDEIISSIGTATSQGGRTGKARALIFVAESARLECARLTGVQADIEGARERFLKGLGAVARCVGQLDQESITLAEFTPVISCTQGMVQTLLDIIEEVRGMLASTVEYTGESYELIKPIGYVASNLTSTMHELSANVHLIALNAEIQAAQLGAGTGLEVLSARTTMVSNETNRIAEEVANKLDQFGSDLVGIVDSFQSLFEEGKTQVETIGEEGRAEEVGLHAIRDFMLQSLLDVDKLVKEIGEMSNGAGRKINREIVDDGAIDAAIAEMERIGMLARECLGGVHGSRESAEHLTGIGSRCSMDSQRDVRGSNVGTAVTASEDDFELPGLDDSDLEQGVQRSRNDSGNRVATTGDALGGNVELF